jgi:hypothetical protein
MVSGNNHLAIFRDRFLSNFSLSPPDFARTIVLNTATLYGRIFEQCDRICVRKKKVADERSTS